MSARSPARNKPWWNRTLCAVNDTWVRLGVLDGDFHWHKHAEEDEFFLVLEGRLDIELEDRTVSLGPNQGFTVPAASCTSPRPRPHGGADGGESSCTPAPVAARASRPLF